MIRPTNHAAVSRAVSQVIDTAARGGVPYVIVFSGRRGVSAAAAAISGIPARLDGTVRLRATAAVSAICIETIARAAAAK